MSKNPQGGQEEVLWAKNPPAPAERSQTPALLDYVMNGNRRAGDATVGARACRHAAAHARVDGPARLRRDVPLGRRPAPLDRRASRRRPEPRAAVHEYLRCGLHDARADLGRRPVASRASRPATRGYTLRDGMSSLAGVPVRSIQQTTIVAPATTAGKALLLSKTSATIEGTPTFYEGLLGEAVLRA